MRRVFTDLFPIILTRTKSAKTRRIRLISGLKKTMTNGFYSPHIQIYEPV
jgi:hypothetical protein